MYVFISHSSHDAAFAEKVCALLESAGHKCFIAPRDIRSGKVYAEELMLGIERSDVLVLLMSRKANSSPHVLREVEHAASTSIPILVYSLEEVELTKSMEYFLMTHQWVNQALGEDLHVILDSIDNMQEYEDGNIRKENVTRKLEPGEMLRNEPAKHTTLTAAALIIAAIAIVIGVRTYMVWNARGQTPEKEDIHLGDSVVLGTYNEEPVSWRVIHMSEDGSRAILITENIITMKAYDAAESDRFNMDHGNSYWTAASEDFEDKALEAKVRGNNDWGSSSIRTWLNSDAEVVSYAGGPPTNMVMSDMKNGYAYEKGFLYGFSGEERAVIVETQIETKGNALSKDSTQVTQDKVFLLDLEELKWLEEAGVNVLAKPTEAAVRQDATGWYGVYSLDYGIENYYWWLREPKEGSVSQCFLVLNGFTEDTTTYQTVGVEGFGIRPAVGVDLRALSGLIYE